MDKNKKDYKSPGSGKPIKPINPILRPILKRAGSSFAGKVFAVAVTATVLATIVYVLEPYLWPDLPDQEKMELECTIIKNTPSINKVVACRVFIEKYGKVRDGQNTCDYCNIILGCLESIQPNNCDTYVDYIIEQECGECVDVFKRLLEKEQCPATVSYAPDDDTDCYEARRIGSKQAYRNYLQKWRMSGNCSRAFLDSLCSGARYNCTNILDSLRSCAGNTPKYKKFWDRALLAGCQEVVECESARNLDSCYLYQDYISTYSRNGLCFDEFQSIILADTCITYPPKYGDCLSEILTRDSCSYCQSNMQNNAFPYQCKQRCQEVLDNCKTDICNRVRSENTCDAYEAYLEEFGNYGSCSQEFQQQLEDCRACEEALRKKTCKAYKDYLKKYGSNGRCSQDFQKKVEICDPPLKDCEMVSAGGRSFRAFRTGGLWWTTENVQQGQLYTWSEAKNATAPVCPYGWRIPCEQEYKYLTEDYYKRDPYKYLIGEQCKFGARFEGYQEKGIRKKSGEVAYFWTQTEADDHTGWYLAIEKNGKSVKLKQGNKNWKLPCRCVKREENFKSARLENLQCPNN